MHKEHQAAHRGSYINKGWHKGMLALVFCGLLACQPQPKEAMKANVLYSNEAFSVTTDSVVQGAYTAQATPQGGLRSNYQSPANQTYSRHVEFKFSLNGKDNELPVGVNHHLIMYRSSPEADTVQSPLIVFGQPDAGGIPQTPQNDFLEPNTWLHLRLDLRPVLQAFEQQGYYQDFAGQRLYANDFKGVFVAGNAEPLSWDFENLPSRPQFQLQDPDQDGIYELHLRMNAYDADNFTAQDWQPSANVQGFPAFNSQVPLANALYHMSLEEVLQNIRPDSAFMAGAKWEGVWTRDISYSILLGLALIAPEVSQKSLMHKVNARGYIIQDTGTGGSWPVSTDRATWVMAAWEVYLATGSQNWLDTIAPIIMRTLEQDRLTVQDPTTGLIYGESSFLDWRKQTYPRWMGPAAIYQSRCLGTNAVFYRAFEIAAKIKALKGQDNAAFAQAAQRIKQGINKHLWNPQGYYNQFLYNGPQPLASPRSETLGQALCVLFGIAEPQRAGQVVANSPVMPYGAPCVYPQTPGIPPYHNNGIWPFVQAYFTWASARVHNAPAVNYGIGTLYRQAALFLTNKENMVAQTGDFKGTEINSDRQLWSVAGNLAMVYRVLLGMQLSPEGLHFAPHVPQAWQQGFTLNNMPYRQASLNISVTGHGSQIKSFVLNGQAQDQPVLPANLSGTNTIQIELAPGKEEAPQGVNLQAFHEVPATVTGITPAPVAIGVKASTPTYQVSWQPAKGASQYRIYQNNMLLDSTTATSYDLPVPATGMHQFYVAGVDSAGYEGFVAPLANLRNTSVALEAEAMSPAVARTYQGYKGSGYVNLASNGSPDINVRVAAPQAGRYRMYVRYANGNGPINTDNKCALRSVYNQEGAFQGLLVLPQLGYDEWSNWGYSPYLALNLQQGANVLSLKLDSLSANMNGRVNQAVIDRIWFIKEQ